MLTSSKAFIPTNPSNERVLKNFADFRRGCCKNEQLLVIFFHFIIVSQQTIQLIFAQLRLIKYLYAFFCIDICENLGALRWAEMRTFLRVPFIIYISSISILFNRNLLAFLAALLLFVCLHTFSSWESHFTAFSQTQLSSDFSFCNQIELKRTWPLTSFYKNFIVVSTNRNTSKTCLRKFLHLVRRLTSWSRTSFLQRSLFAE